jgi:rfaE bifunctional protein kinase chain/domain
MDAARFAQLTARYASLRLAVIGDFCLDRYLEIDPARAEVSIETGLAVLNVVRVRAQAGAAGTVLNNLVALGIGTLHVIGFAGEDGEGYELRRALGQLSGVRLEHFRQTPERRTFTYCKPLIVTPDEEPRELNRLDSKNWTPTPSALGQELAASLTRLAPEVDAVIVMEQVDLAGTGAITPEVFQALAALATQRPELPIVADSRRGLGDYPPIRFKMNLAELRVMLGDPHLNDLDDVAAGAAQLARERGRPVFVTMAEKGIFGGAPDGTVEHVPSYPVRGTIDVVGAGDSVTANLSAALAAGATLREAMELAMAAASTVIHQLGTTGVATVADLSGKIFGAGQAH